MKYPSTITPVPPRLDEESFQRLLAAAYLLQESKNDPPCENGFWKKARGAAIPAPVQVPLTPQPTVEMFEQKYCLIPAETAYQLSQLASQLEALSLRQYRGDFQAAPLPVSISEEVRSEGQQAGTSHPSNAPLEDEPSESAQLAPREVRAVASGMNSSPLAILGREIPQGNRFFWNTATAFVGAAVLILLLGTSIDRLFRSPKPVLSREVDLRNIPLDKTPAGESLAIQVKPSMPRPAPVDNFDWDEKKVVTSKTLLPSTYDSDAHLTDENARVASQVEEKIRTDSRFKMTQVQVRASSGVVTLQGNVSNEAERVAAGHDAAQVRGVEALVNELRVGTSVQGRTNAPKPSVAVARAPTGESSPEVASSPSAILAAVKIPRTEPEPIILPAGTVLAVRLTETLSSTGNQPGNTFLANLASPVVIGDKVIIPERANITGRVVEARNGRRFSGRSALVIEVIHLDFNGKTYDLHSSQYSNQGASRNAYAAAAITAGTGVGTLMGHVLGRGKGAAIGSVLGAAAGTGVQAVTKPASAELPAESTVSFRLETPLQVIPLSIGQLAGSASDHRPTLKLRSPLPTTNTNTSAGPTAGKGSQQDLPPHN